MPETTVEDPPSTWLALSRKLGVSSPLVSLTARTIIAQESGGAAPPKLLPPGMYGSVIIDKVIFNIKQSSSKQQRSAPEKESKARSIDLDRRVRACLDEHQTELGNNLYEKVADELDIDWRLVQKIDMDRHKALFQERKIRAEEQAYLREEALRKRVSSGRRGNAADNARELARGATFQRPLPSAYKAPPEPTIDPVVEAQASPPPTSGTPLGRAPCFPQPNESFPLDEKLRLAWIADHGGHPDVRSAIMLELMKDYGATIDQAHDAIELAYSSRTDRGKQEMAKKAARLAKEKAK